MHHSYKAQPRQLSLMLINVKPDDPVVGCATVHKKASSSAKQLPVGYMLHVVDREKLDVLRMDGCPRWEGGGGERVNCVGQLKSTPQPRKTPAGCGYAAHSPTSRLALSGRRT